MKKKSILSIFLILSVFSTLYGIHPTTVSYKGSLDGYPQIASASIKWQVEEISNVSLWLDSHGTNLWGQTTGHTDSPSSFPQIELEEENDIAVNDSIYLHCRVSGNAKIRLSIKASAPMTSSQGGTVHWGIAEEDGQVITGIGNYDFGILRESLMVSEDINLRIATDSLSNAIWVAGRNVRYSSNMEVKVEIV